MRHTWTTRVVFAMGALLLAGSVVAAAARSSTGPQTLALAATQSAAKQSAAPETNRMAAAKESPKATPKESPKAAPKESPKPSPKAAQAQTAAAPAPGTLFSDNFAADQVGANPPANWTVASGTWNGVIADGAAHAAQHGAAFGLMSAGSANWTDYIASVDVKIPDGNAFAAVAGRYAGPGTYYQCDIHNNNSLQLYLFNNGAETLLSSMPATVDPGTFHTVKLAMKANAIACTLDGTVAATAQDGTLTQGSIALAAGDGEAAEFTNVVVSPAP